MTIEGVTGYGYSSQGNVGQDNAPRGAESDAGHGAHGGAQAGAQVDDHAEDVAVRRSSLRGRSRLRSLGLDCLNRAPRIASSLNHPILSSDHLMLALTMDQNARRLLERVGDVTRFREAAMQKLGHYDRKGATRRAIVDRRPPTSLTSPNCPRGR